MFIKALKIAYKAHHGQVRRDSSIPYIIHPMRVATHFNDQHRKIIAILHDVVEDTPITLEDLRKEFPNRVVEAVDCLTQRPGEKYFKYLKRLKENPIATEIKIADILDNISDNLSVQPKSEIERYDQALKILIG